MLGTHFNAMNTMADADPTHHSDEGSNRGSRTPGSKSPSKRRSWSDGAGSTHNQPILSPSPKFREPQKHSSKDDTELDSPTTPRRPAIARGLSLQMPPREFPPAANLNPLSPKPLSPRLDPADTYGSPASILPRRSRGLDFSRAATNLHHSTLAEPSSPEASPTFAGRAMNIPGRRNGSHLAGGTGSPSGNGNSLWSSMGTSDRANVSGSLGSINMLGSDSSDSGSGDEDLMDADDMEAIMSTPQVDKGASTFGNENHALASPGTSWMGAPSHTTNSFMSIQRARLRHGNSRKSRKSFSSGSSSMASPMSKSPPAMRSIESMGNALQNNSFQSRRESISWAANQLHISGHLSGSESDDSTRRNTLENMDGNPVTPSRDGQRGVIRRVVTRRGNLLPKTKGFARIRAALAEEGAPIESEVRREADVIRQVRESDMDLEPRYSAAQSNSSTAQPSSSLHPTTSNEALEDIPEDDMMTDTASPGNLSGSFKEQAMRNSRGKEFWNSYTEQNNQTPPPPTFLPHGSSSGMSDDMAMDFTPPSSLHSSSHTFFPPPQPHTPDDPATASSTMQSALNMASSSSNTNINGHTQADISRKVNKRRRDCDDFSDLDASTWKRRAVSPGMSLHNSPVLQSPMQRDVNPWGPGGTPGMERDREGSGGSQASERRGNGVGVGTKRVGLQGMVDTNDGLMKMSIE